MALVQRLSRLSENPFMEGVTIAVNNSEYETEFRTADVPKKVRVPARYGLCFQECLLHFVVEADKRKFRGPYPKVNFVCEAGAANAGDAKRIFYEYKSELDNSNLPILGTIKFQDKDDTNPLMMADFWAHTGWWREDKGVRLTPDDIVPPGSERLGITVLSYKPGGPAGRKRQLIEDFERRLATILP